MARPSGNGANGRDGHGRFSKGNPGGPGNPHGQRTAHLRAVLLDAVTDDDLRAIVQKLVEMARAGDLAAARVILERTCGKPIDASGQERDNFLSVNRERLTFDD